MAFLQPLRNRFSRIVGIAALLFAALPFPRSFAVDALSTDLTARLGGGTVLNAPADVLAGAVREQVKATPAKAARVVHLALGSGRADAYKLAPSIVAVAIGALGEKPAPNEVGKIVSAAVKATPTEVLPIVKTAVHAAPGQATANAIVTAAVRSVPDPNEKIAMRSEANGNDHKNVADHKNVRDAKEVRDHKGAPDNIGESLPVKDAIVKAASQADPSLDVAQLQTAANSGVLAGPQPLDGYDPSDPSIDKFPLVSRLGGGLVSGPKPPPPKPISP